VILFQSFDCRSNFFGRGFEFFLKTMQQIGVLIDRKKDSINISAKTGFDFPHALFLVNQFNIGLTKGKPVFFQQFKSRNIFALNFVFLLMYPFQNHSFPSSILVENNFHRLSSLAKIYHKIVILYRDEHPAFSSRYSFNTNLTKRSIRLCGTDSGGVHFTLARADRAGMIQCAAKTRYTVSLPRPHSGDDWRRSGGSGRSHFRRQ